MTFNPNSQYPDVFSVDRKFFKKIRSGFGYPYPDSFYGDTLRQVEDLVVSLQNSVDIARKTPMGTKNFTLFKQELKHIIDSYSQPTIDNNIVSELSRLISPILETKDPMLLEGVVGDVVKSVQNDLIPIVQAGLSIDVALQHNAPAIPAPQAFQIRKIIKAIEATPTRDLPDYKKKFIEHVNTLGGGVLNQLLHPGQEEHRELDTRKNELISAISTLRKEHSTGAERNAAKRNLQYNSYLFSSIPELRENLTNIAKIMDGEVISGEDLKNMEKAIQHLSDKIDAVTLRSKIDTVLNEDRRTDLLSRHPETQTLPTMNPEMKKLMKKAQLVLESKDNAQHQIDRDFGTISALTKVADDVIGQYKSNISLAQTSNPKESEKHLPVSNFCALFPEKEKKKKNLLERFIETRVGQGIAKVAPWVFSKGVIRAYNIIVPAVAFAGIGATVGVAPYALPLAAGAMLFNSIRDTTTFRRIKALEKEHNLLVDTAQARKSEITMMEELKSLTGVDLNKTREKELKGLKDEHTGVHKPAYNAKYDNAKKRALWKTILGSTVESSANIATVALVATSGLANATMNAISIGTLAGVVGVIDIVKTTSDRKKMDAVKNGMRKNIDAMREDIPYYRNSEELAQINREQRIHTEALRSLMKENLKEMSEEQIKKRFDLEVLNLKSSKEFEIPQTTRWGEIKQYLKDFGAVHWPSKHYGSGKDLAGELDKYYKDTTGKYQNMAEEVKQIQKRKGEERKEQKHSTRAPYIGKQSNRRESQHVRS